jgi:histone chaperone ASF1
VEFRVVYVGSTQGPEYDQTLESVMVGPVPVGVSKFVLEAPAPKLELIPQTDIVGLTVMLLSCFYLDKEFIRVGYYVNNDYVEEELRENPPPVPDLSKIQRNILAEKPRVSFADIGYQICNSLGSCGTESRRDDQGDRRGHVSSDEC